MKNLTKTEIEKRLKNPFLIKQIIKSLLANFNHELILKPRLFFQQNTKGQRYIQSYEAFHAQNPEMDEEDFWGLTDEDTCYEDDYDPHGQYYRRDTFLTGAAVTSAILEQLTGEKTIINDIDLFYYHFQATNNVDAKHERYNNLQGEDACYHIAKVKEHGTLNLIQINIEDEFGWTRMIQSFDLNYPQVGIILATNEIVFTDEFIEFLQTKTISLSKNFSDDFPLTSYIRAIHKSHDLNAKFYTMDVVKPFIAMDLGEEIFKENVISFPITCDREEAENNGILLVTKKRFDYWLKNPTMVPYLTPSLIAHQTTLTHDVKETMIGDMKVNLPDEPWIDICKTLYSLTPQKTQEYYPASVQPFLKELIQIIPNFYNLKNSQAYRLKNLLSSNLMKIRNHNGKYCWTEILKKNPQIMKEDFSAKALAGLEQFAKLHEGFYKDFNWFLLNHNYSIPELLELQTAIKNWEIHHVGTLESIGFANSNFTAGTKYIYHVNYNSNFPEYHAIVEAIISKDIVKIKEECNKLFLKNLAQNFLAHPLKIEPFKKYVKELTQSDQLVLEGKKMNHCVAGFASNVKNGTSRIFHIEVNGKHSTLELELHHYNPNKHKFIFKDRQSRTYQQTFMEAVKRKNKTSQESQKPVMIVKRMIALAQREKFQKVYLYTWKQHQSHHNSEPDYLNNLIGKKLVNYLNDYNQNYQVIINKNKPK